MKKLRMTVNIAMTAVLLGLMAYSLIGTLTHEILGTLMFLLFTVHHILNRKWFGALPKGRYNSFRIAQTTLVIMLIVSVLASAVSGIILSEHLFRFLRISSGAWAARSVHMVCAYLNYILMSLHLGFHWNAMISSMSKNRTGRSDTKQWIMRVISIAIAAYSYMALVPVIFPPIIKLCTTKKERSIKMETLKEVTKSEKILFPIIVTLICCILVPSCTPLIGCLMFGNLIKESGVVPNLVHTASNALLYICTILLGLSVGATAIGTTFLQPKTLMIFVLGILAFVIAAICGLLGGKLMCLVTKGKVNPMIGAAGVSAVPMAARVVHKIGQEEDPDNYLLMHAMGPNVSGVIGSAIAAGILLSMIG